MRDAMDARIWVDHHDKFSKLLDNGLAALRRRLSSLPSWDGSTQHLFALVAAFAITALTFNTTA